MEMNDAITVTKLNIQDQRGYLMIGWQRNSFEMYLYIKDNLWKGRFSPNRLAGFSKNLKMNETDYFNSVKRCLSQEQNDYVYDITNDFFFWKRKLNSSALIEGFLPINRDISDNSAQPDLVELLLAMNEELKNKLSDLKNKFETIKLDYQKCLKDTEEFLNLKIEMEKALCDKFLNLLQLQKSKVEIADGNKYGELENKMF